jgi:Tol biopolymer transport system component
VVHWRKLVPAACCVAGAGLALPAFAAALPPGYGYEKVSPGAAAKGDSDVQFQYGAVRSAPDGTRVTYEMPVASDSDEGSFYPPQVLATLGSDGWSVRGITPPLDPDPGGAQFDNRLGYQTFADDLSSGATVQGDPPLVPGAATGHGIRNIYRRDLFGDGGYQLVSPAPPGGAAQLSEAAGFATVYYAPVVADATPDLRSIVFETNLIGLTSDAAGGCALVAPCPFGPFKPNVYEWVDGNVRLVSILDDGTPSPAGAVPGAGMSGGVFGGGYNTQNIGGRVMSRDGHRIFFTVPRSREGYFTEGDVYVRIDGTTTRLVSRSLRTVPDPAGRQPARFVSASDDGRYVFISSAEQLTDSSTADASKRDLYRYDVDMGTLVDLTSGLGPNDSFNRAVGASRDGSTIYFVTGSSNLWVWDGDTPRLVTVADPSDGSFINHNTEDAIVQGAQQSVVSGDGRWLVFSSRARLAGSDPGDTTQLYLYDRNRDEVVSCISCPPGRAASSSAWTNNRAVFAQLPIIRDYPARNFNASDDRFIFMTADRLSPEDKNSAFDVYQYDLNTGVAALISPGRGTDDAYFADASADGNTVFFATRNRVLRQDDDRLIDLYVARPGARDEDLEPVAPCAGDACQGPTGTQPEEVVPGTVTFTGPGDEDEIPRDRVFSVAPITRAQAGTFARRGRINLSVRVSDAGTVTAQARGKLGKRTQVIGRTSKRAAQGGAVVVTLRLSRVARRYLARHRTLRVTINVSFSDGGGQQHASVLLTRVATKAKRGAR